MIECPRLLFPFARNIIASATRDAGYPPLLLDPIDFAGAYLAQLEAGQAAQGGEGNGSGSMPSEAPSES
jgi:preprotein translocase subunit SecB